MKKNIMIYFTGQGSQFPGMGKDFYDKFASVKELYKSAGAYAGQSMIDLCFNGTQEQLNDTKNTQPAIVTCQLGTLYALEEVFDTSKVRILGTTGHSLGMYAALFSAGVMNEAQCIETVAVRGKAMAPIGGNLGQIRGVNFVDVVKALSGSDYSAALHNAPGTVVIGGEKENDGALELLKDLGIKRIRNLPVSGAFHTYAFKKIAPEYENYLKTLSIQDPLVPVFSNIRKGVYPAIDRDELHSNGQAVSIKSDMVKQLYTTVDWVGVMENMLNPDLNVDYFIEIGPKSLIEPFFKKMPQNKDKKLEEKLLHICNVEDLERVVSLL